MTLTYISGVVHAVLSPFFSSNEPDEPHYGADAVEAAINEVSSIANREFIATLGEPELKDFGGFFQRDWKVIVPVSASDYEDPGPLVFDLPRGMGDEKALLYTLMDAVDAQDIYGIAGAKVPMEVVGGNPMVFWDAFVDDGESADDELDVSELDEEALDEANLDRDDDGL